MGAVTPIRKPSAKERREATLAETVERHAALGPIDRLKVEAGAIEDAILSVEGQPRGTKAATIQTERGFVLNQALRRLRGAVEMAERMDAAIHDEEEKTHG